MAVVLFTFLSIDLQEAVVVSRILLCVPSVYLLVEEVVHDEVAMDAPSDVDIVDLSLLEIRVECNLKGRKDGRLGLVKLESVVPVLEQLEGLVDIAPNGVSLGFGLQIHLKG